MAAAVADLNYRPDTAGRSLRSARHKSIGMIVVDESPLYLSDGSTTQVVSGLGNALNAEGYTLQLEGLRARDLENSSLLRLVRTDGVCLMLSGRPAQRRAMLASVAKAEPAADRFLRALRQRRRRPVPASARTTARGGILLAEHLFERGARRIMIVKRSTLNQMEHSVDERVRGIRSVAAKRGGQVEIVGCGGGAFDEVQAAVGEAIAEGRPAGRHHGDDRSDGDRGPQAAEGQGRSRCRSKSGSPASTPSSTGGCPIRC